MFNYAQDNNVLTKSKHSNINVGMLNFQPMPKRFMVWDKGLNKFYSGSEGKPYIFDIWSLIEFLNNSQRYPEQLEIVQSTNLFDKDGKEIFEGSVLEIPDDYEEYGMAAGQKYLVYFNAGGFRLRPNDEYNIKRGSRGYWLEDTSDLKLLGHILSNLELMENSNA